MSDKPSMRDLTVIHNTYVGGNKEYAEYLFKLMVVKYPCIRLGFNNLGFVKKYTSTGRIMNKLDNYQRQTMNYDRLVKVFDTYHPKIDLRAVDLAAAEQRIMSCYGAPGLITVCDLCYYYDTSDVHIARACHEYGVAVKDVTVVMRAWAKRLNWYNLYGISGGVL